MQNIAVNKNEDLEEAKKAFELSEKESLEAHHKASFRCYTQRKPLEETIANLVAIQNIVVNKKEAFELAEKESLEAQRNVYAIELEIEAIKVKCQFEEAQNGTEHFATNREPTMSRGKIYFCNNFNFHHLIWFIFLLQIKES